MDKDDELVQVQRKLKSQESEIFRHQQQKEELQQKYDDTKEKHKLEIAKINGKFASNTEELFRLRIHNKIVLTKIKKLKNSWKMEPFNEDLKGIILEKEEENQ